MDIVGIKRTASDVMNELKTFEFSSTIMSLDMMHPWSQEDVRNEPMLYRCDRHHARKWGGPITQNFLDIALTRTPDTTLITFDSKVVMLKPGWYPCIPGFHHDDVPRTRKDGQPDYRKPPYRSQHAMAIVGSDVSCTRFALGRAKFPEVPLGQIAYKTWHPLVVEKLESGELHEFQPLVGEVIQFNDQAWHEGVAASGSGWRWFGRVSWNTDRAKQPKNEHRTQVQVYMKDPMEGW